MKKETLKIPSQETCELLFHQMDMMDHIINHSRQVCRVALFLVDQLKKKDIEINRELVRAAALLHDITKVRSFKTGENHALTGALFLESQGYPEVSNIVGQHVTLNTYCLSDSINEAEIINYADKRVLHDQVVSLVERMHYILEKYCKDSVCNKDKAIDLFEKTKKIEEKIFKRIPFSPDDLPRILG